MSAEGPGQLLCKAFVEKQPQVHGQWKTSPTLMPINPVHVALLNTGKVLVIAGSGNVPGNKDYEALVLDPKTQLVEKPLKLTWDMFCSGMVILPNGSPLILGGTKSYPNKTLKTKFAGEPYASIFDPVAEQFMDTKKTMGRGRWYPTGTVLSDGSVMVIGGWDESGAGNTNMDVQKYEYLSDTWSTIGTAFQGVPLYPREHLLKIGNIEEIFETGANPDSQMLDPSTGKWSKVDPTHTGPRRDHGTSVLLPLDLSNNPVLPKVLILGGSNVDQIGSLATNSAEIMDFSKTPWKWVTGNPMRHAREELNATLLPNLQVLVSGGSLKNEIADLPSREAELYDSSTGTFSSASTMECAHLYHSNTLLLPDATVLAVGGNPKQKTYERHIEIYSPPYLFDKNGKPATRPDLAAPAVIHYGSSFQISTQNVNNIGSVVLVRPGAVTHAFDMEQRLIKLVHKIESGALTAIAPPDGTIAPPGFYLLFILDSTGVPSKGQFVQLMK